jgi:hypothetical protein
MGGSVLYNPVQPSSGQLAPSVHVAIRLGRIDRETTVDGNYAYSDRAGDASYGYITVSSIDKDQIGFTYTRYSADGQSNTVRSFLRNLDEPADINGDGLADISYTLPKRKRPGMEKAVYLSFLSSRKTLNTSMFAVLPEKYSRGVYPSGLIGINPYGQFIVTKHEGKQQTAPPYEGCVRRLCAELSNR